jgi:hypothetical protein
MLVVGFALSGCESSSLLRSEADTDIDTTDTDIDATDTTDTDTDTVTARTDLVSYGSAVRALSEPDLEAEYRTLLSRQSANPTDETSLRLALLMSNPGAPFHDLDRALQILNDIVLRQDQDGSNGELARLMHHLLGERTCVAPADAPLAEVILAERDRNSQLSEELDETQTALDTERQLRQTLQGQLDALKALEERLNETQRER